MLYYTILYYTTLYYITILGLPRHLRRGGPPLQDCDPPACARRRPPAFRQSLYLSVSPSLCLFVCLSVSLCVSLCLSVSLCLCFLPDLGIELPPGLHLHHSL